MKTTIASWLEEARKKLASITETASLDAQVLLSSTIHKDRSWVIAHPEFELKNPILEQLNGTLVQLQHSTPLPYITGRAHFFGLEFHVTPDVLIPRPETEMLVEEAISWCKKTYYQGSILDVGTGSGCIAITLAKHLPKNMLMATDRSMSALRIAFHNSQLHHVGKRIHFIQTDLISAISTKVGLICANLPYIPTSKLARLVVAQNEPRSALDGGQDGFDLISRLLLESTLKVSKQVCLLIEIESSQGSLAINVGSKYYPDASVTIKKDLAGLDRLLVIERDAK